MTHIDDWLDSQLGTIDPGTRRAIVALTIARMPASLNEAFVEIIGRVPLFCTYAGRRWRCTGASRLGSVWLTDNYAQHTGYTDCVDVAACSEWSKVP